MLVLKALFENQKMYFRSIGSDIEGLQNPSFTKRVLDELIDGGFVKREANENWRGRKVFYSLTPKGRTEYIRIALNDVNRALETIKSIGDNLLSDSSKLEEWRRMSREALLQFKITEDMPLNGRINTVLAATHKTYGPLIESYRNMHRIICQLLMLRDLDYFIGFTKDGGLHLIFSRILEEP